MPPPFLPSPLTLRTLGGAFLAQALQEQIRTKMVRGTRYPGLTCFDEGIDYIAIPDIPGVKEAGWLEDEGDAAASGGSPMIFLVYAVLFSAATLERLLPCLALTRQSICRCPGSEGYDPKLQEWLRNIFRDLKRHEDSWPFLKPVNPDTVPDYYTVIKNPIDMQTIWERIRDQVYPAKEDFINDIYLVCLSGCWENGSRSCP